MNTPDTEWDSDKEVVGSDCLCVLGSEKHNPECEYAKPTPDTEWQKEFDEGNYYSFIHHKNQTLSEFAEYVEEHPELRFYQALSAWTGKDITVGGEDPFYWTNKLQ